MWLLGTPLSTRRRKLSTRCPTPASSTARWLAASLLKPLISVSHVVHGVGHDPAAVDPPGQHLPDVLAHFLFDQSVQLCVHRLEQFAVPGRIDSQIVAFER